MLKKHLLLCALASAATLHAAPPYINYLYPAGARQGSNFTLTLGGTSLANAHAVFISGEGVSGQVLDILEPTEQQIREAKALDEVAAQSATVEIHIAPNAPEGVRDLRIQTPEGLSNRFRFTVSRLPEILEKEPNNSHETAQAVPALPVILNGQITRADHDFFRFKATEGQNLLFDVQARALKPYLADGVPGWFQARIIIRDANGNQIAQADDFRFDPDPVLAWKAPATGDYTIEIWDAVARGRADLVYRIRIGELPYVFNFFPLGARRGEKSRDIRLTGINLGKNATLTNAPLRVKYPDDAPSIVQIGTHTPSGLTNTHPFEIGELPEIFEKEPNHYPRQALAAPLTLPVTINGRIQQPGDVDNFAFQAEEGQTLSFNVMARRLDSPLDARLRLLKMPGAALITQVDDTKDDRYGLLTHHADPRFLWTFKQSGNYVIQIEDAQDHGGPEYAYRLHISPPQPDFEIRVTPDNLSVPVGSNVVLKIKAIRFDKFNGPINLRLTNLPGFELSGATIPEGKNETILTLSAPANTPPGFYYPRFQAEAVINGKTVVHDAPQAEELMQAFFYYHTVPVDKGYLVVTPPSPFTVELLLDTTQTIELPLHTDVKIPVKLPRLDPEILKAIQAKQAAETAAREAALEARHAAAQKAAAAAKPAPQKPKNPDAKPAKKPAPKPAAAGQPAAAKTDAPKRPFYHAPAATPELREWEELVLEKFDLNKNGRLDRPKEHAALLAAIKAGKFPPPPGGRFHQQPAAKPAGQPAAAAKTAGQPAAAKTDAQNAKPKAVKNADAKPKNADAKAKKNPDAKPKGKRRNAQPKQDPATIPVRVTLGKFIKGVQPTAAVIEPGQTEGELVLRVVDEKLVGSEGVMIIDGTQRWRGGKTISTAPALRYKILPAPPGAEEKPRVPLPPEEKAKIKKAAGKG